SNNLYPTQVTKWDFSALSANADFVFPARALTQTYDGNGTHRDTAEEYSYDAYGNLTTKIMWGEVLGSDDGTFVDTGSDKFTTTSSYASNPTLNIIGLPSQETITDQTSNKVKETKYYYDNLALGDANKGNLTKQEQWKSGIAYINSQKTYDSFGLVLQKTDPNGNTTNYSYDTFNLYLATVTNAENRATGYLYDYSLGKVKQITDPNGF